MCSEDLDLKTCWSPAEESLASSLSIPPWLSKLQNEGVCPGARIKVYWSQEEDCQWWAARIVNILEDRCFIRYDVHDPSNKVRLRPKNTLKKPDINPCVCSAPKPKPKPKPETETETETETEIESLTVPFACISKLLLPTCY